MKSYCGFNSDMSFVWFTPHPLGEIFGSLLR